MDEKLVRSVNELKAAFAHRSKAETDYLTYAGIAKCFEVCLEYSWKFLKRRIEAEGLEAFSPKDVVKVAGQAGIIGDVELWLKAISIRNIAVHDYLGISQNEYLSLIDSFIPLAEKLI